MATAGVTRLAKPQLRGLLNSQIGKNIGVAFVLSVIAGVAFKFGFYDPRRNTIAEFYTTYDADAEFERMRKAGVFQSASADGAGRK